MTMHEPIEKEVRYYQREAADVSFQMIEADPKCKPIIGLPTGTGKSFTFSLFIDLVLTKDVRRKVLILCDREEILEQDHEELEEFYDMEIGLYSAGLESFTIKKITVASIQSIWRKPELFSEFTHIIVDECDSVNEDIKSMYRSFFKVNDVPTIGATATPYGLKGGMLYEGKNPFFTCMSVDYTRGEKYNKLVEDGYLPKIFAKPTSVKFDDKNLKTIAGDFSLKDQSEQFDQDPITRAAIIETIYYGENYARWLLFAIDIHHAESISRMLTEMNITNCVVHSKMEGDRRKILKESKSGKYRAIVNVDILTIGYNDKKIDMIGLYFCTKSIRKHIQTTGRFRKDVDCEYKLVLDFGGNFKRLGPINDPKIKSLNDKKKGSGDPMMKECPQCTILNYLSAKICCNCDFEFPVAPKLTKKADIDAEAIRKEFNKTTEKTSGVKGWADVTDILYSRAGRVGEPDWIKVTYVCGIYKIFVDVKIEHDGYPKILARNWIDYRWEGNTAPPRTVKAFLDNKQYIMPAKRIKVDRSGKFVKVTDCTF